MGPVEHQVGTLDQLAGASALATATRRTSTPRASSRSRASKAGQVAPVVADEAHRLDAGDQASTAVPLSAATGGCSSKDILARRTTRPDRCRLGRQPTRATAGPSPGCSPVVEGERQALGLDVHAHRSVLLGPTCGVGDRVPPAASTGWSERTPSRTTSRP